MEVQVSMPERKKNNQPTPKSEQARAMWGSYGKTEASTVETWDPKTSPLVQALLTVVASGATVVLRPGSGGRAVGIAIWEGDERHAPRWVYDSEEMDEWAQWVIDRRDGQRVVAAD